MSLAPRPWGPSCQSPCHNTIRIIQYNATHYTTLFSLYQELGVGSGSVSCHVCRVHPANLPATTQWYNTTQSPTLKSPPRTWSRFWPLVSLVPCLYGPSYQSPCHNTIPYNTMPYITISTRVHPAISVTMVITLQHNIHQKPGVSCGPLMCLSLCLTHRVPLWTM